MDEGRIVEQGKPADVLDRPKEERTKRFLRRSLQLADSLEELHIDDRRRGRMKKLLGVCAAFAVVAAAVADVGRRSAHSTEGQLTKASSATKLPALPPEIKAAQALEHRREVRLRRRSATST